MREWKESKTIGLYISYCRNQTDKVKSSNFLNMLCNNKKIGNCVTLLRLTPRKLGGKHRPYVPNDTETDLTLTNTFGSLKSIWTFLHQRLTFVLFLSYLLYILQKNSIWEKIYNISINDKNYELLRKWSSYLSTVYGRIIWRTLKPHVKYRDKRCCILLQWLLAL